jgi:NADPH:quinone reductase-like Zn-dependent oxidoreductase
MKAIVVNQYGGTEVLKFEEYPDPGPAEVLVRAPPRA